MRVRRWCRCGRCTRICTQENCRALRETRGRRGTGRPWELAGVVLRKRLFTARDSQLKFRVGTLSSTATSSRVANHAYQKDLPRWLVLPLRVDGQAHGEGGRVRRYLEHERRAEEDRGPAARSPLVLARALPRQAHGRSVAVPGVPVPQRPPRAHARADLALLRPVRPPARRVPRRVQAGGERGARRLQRELGSGGGGLARRRRSNSPPTARRRRRGSRSATPTCAK